MDATSPFWPTVNVVRGKATVVVDSLLLVFFLDREACADPQPILNAFELYLHGPAQGQLHYYVDDDGETHPLPPDPMTMVRDYVVPLSRRGEMLDLRLDDKEQPGHRHEARFLHNPEADPDWPDEKSVAYFRIAQSSLANFGVEALMSFVDRLCECLPYSYGYASPALAYSNFFAEVLPYISRHPGFDVVYPPAIRIEIGDRPLGAYWLNLFGPRLSEALGGTVALRAALPPEASVSDVPGGGTRVLLGSQPDVGDLNRQRTLPLYRRLATFLRPWLRLPTIASFTDEEGMADREAEAAWYGRYLDDPLDA